MNFTRQELALIQTALCRYVSQDATQHYGHSGEEAKKLRNRIQSHLLSDEPSPVTIRSET